MNAKEKIEELLEASEDGTITAAQGAIMAIELVCSAIGSFFGHIPFVIVQRKAHSKKTASAISPKLFSLTVLLEYYLAILTDVNVNVKSPYL